MTSQAHSNHMTESSPLLGETTFSDDDKNQARRFNVFCSKKFLLLFSLLAFIVLGTTCLHNHYYIHTTHYRRRATIVQALVHLNNTLEGEVIFYNQDGFEDAAKVWNSQVRAPLVVIQPHTQADVQKALPVLAQLASLHGLPFRVRSGGHHKAGYSSVAGGAVLSLVKMNEITLDANHYNKSSDAGTSMKATFGPAVRVRDVLEKVLVPYGYAGVVGACNSVAESGFVLGGGFGFQSRMHGLGADNVESMRVVLVDGRVVEASATQHKDLFFALRGAGGGNFGIVTEIQYRLYKVHDMQLFGMVNGLDYSGIASFLQKLGDMKLPDELVVMFDNVLGTVQAPQVGLIWFGNNNAKGMSYIKSEIVPVVPNANVSLQPFAWSSLTDAEPSREDDDDSHGSASPDFSSWEHPYAQAWCGFLFADNNTVSVWTDIMSIFEKLLKKCPHLLPDIELWGGAISRIPWNATAFPYRDAIYNVGVLLMVPPTDAAAYYKQVKEVNEWWPLVSEYLTGSYNNYPMESLSKGNYGRAYWGDNLDRLMKIKQRYDPGNVMSFEQSIPIATK